MEAAGAIPLLLTTFQFKPMAEIILVQEEPRGPSQLIEVPVPAQVIQRVQFPDIQQLRSQVGQKIIIKGIRLITDKVLANSPTLGLTNATKGELQKISLVIYSMGWEKGQLIPVLTLNDMNDSDSTDATTIPFRNNPTRFSNWENVDWPKTYLQYSNGTPSDGSAYAVLFDVLYEKLDSQGQPIITPS